MLNSDLKQHLYQTISRSEVSDRDDRQRVVLDWARRTFVNTDVCHPKQRSIRFLEEAVELFQAVYYLDAPKGWLSRLIYDWRTFWKAVEIVRYVFSRPPGEVGQEIGGTMVTIMGVAEVTGRSVAGEELKEIRRVLDKDPKKFQAKQLQKPNQ